MDLCEGCAGCQGRGCYDSTRIGLCRCDGTGCTRRQEAIYKRTGVCVGGYSPTEEVRREFMTLRARRDGEGLSAWCRFCRTYHHHSGEAGHREAHCTDRSSPYLEIGYILAVTGNVVNIEDARRR